MKSTNHLTELACKKTRTAAGLTASKTPIPPKGPPFDTRNPVYQILPRVEGQVVLDSRKGLFCSSPALRHHNVILQQLLKSLRTMVEDELVYTGLIEMQELDAQR